MLSMGTVSDGRNKESFYISQVLRYASINNKRLILNNIYFGNSGLHCATYENMSINVNYKLKMVQIFKLLHNNNNKQSGPPPHRHQLAPTKGRLSDNLKEVRGTPLPSSQGNSLINKCQLDGDYEH